MITMFTIFRPESADQGQKPDASVLSYGPGNPPSERPLRVAKFASLRRDNKHRSSTHGRPMYL